MSALQWRQTKDGSLTCLYEPLKELYHNSAGAFTEATQNYVLPSGWKQLLTLNNRHLTLFDVCFGLGYNSFTLLADIINDGQQNPDSNYTVTLYCFENDLNILKGIPTVLNDPRLSILKNYSAHFEHNIYYQTRLVGNEDDIRSRLEGYFSMDHPEKPKPNLKVVFNWMLGDFRYFLPLLVEQAVQAELIFHDAFAPNKVPELWTVDIFKLYNQLLNTNGRLLTYSATGGVREGLKESGFKVYKTSGLGRKKGGTIGTTVKIKPDNLVSELNTNEKEFLSTQSGLPFRDESLCATRETIMERRYKEQSESTRPKWDRQTASIVIN